MLTYSSSVRLPAFATPALCFELDAYNRRTYGELETEVLVRLDDVQPAHDRTLVIRRSSTVQFARALGIWCELERLMEPSILFERRLDIVVTVHQERFLR